MKCGLPLKRSTYNLPYNTAVSLQPKQRQIQGNPGPNNLSSSPALPPTQNPLHSLPRQFTCVWLELLFFVGCQATLSCFQMWKYPFIKRCLLHFIFKEHLPVSSLLTYISEFLYHLFLNNIEI